MRARVCVCVRMNAYACIISTTKRPFETFIFTSVCIFARASEGFSQTAANSYTHNTFKSPQLILNIYVGACASGHISVHKRELAHECVHFVRKSMHGHVSVRVCAYMCAAEPVNESQIQKPYTNFGDLCVCLCLCMSMCEQVGKSMCV